MITSEGHSSCSDAQGMEAAAWKRETGQLALPYLLLLFCEREREERAGRASS